MPHPLEVITRKFKPKKLIYSIDGFSIVYGVWENKSNHLAIRWDGEKGKIGFPQSFGKPQWLLLPDELTIPFSKALLDTNSEVDKKFVLNLLKVLL